MVSSRFWPFGFLLAGAVLGPVALFAVGAWQSHAQLYEQAEETAKRQAAGFAEHAEKTLQSAELVIEQANQRISGLSWDEIRTSRPLWEDLSRLDKQVPEVDAIFVVDAKGIGALTTRVFPSPPVDFSQRDYFKAQLRDGLGTYLGGSVTGLISHHAIFNMSVRRQSAAGGFDGVVGVSISDYFERFYGRDLMPDGFAVSLVHDSGEILAQYPPGQAARAEPIPPSPSGLFTDADPASGGQRIVAFQRLASYPAYVAISVADTSIRNAWLRYVVRWGALAGVSAVALLGLALIALSWMRREADAVARQQETYASLIEEERRRKHAEAALVETRKLEALGQLTGGVAHDFNNLLQALGGNLRLALSRTADERVRRALDGCERTVERGQALVQKLLAFARRQPLQYEVFDANARLEALRELLHQSAPLVALKIVTAPDLWPVESDAGQLDLAILNLVVNARDSITHVEGVVTVETSNVILNGAAGELDGPFVAVKVTDNGAGIPPEALQRVWEPFFTTKPAGKGTGLGLSMVYGFARQSGGGVSIESEVGRGTTVTIYLPKGMPVQAYGDQAATGRTVSAA
ncbi:MAG TPA: ATP-binding protein [Alphaproteobacteria bacterium]|nr:ATP-binding protein [Alphaproteobacteria bacterium]